MIVLRRRPRFLGFGVLVSLALGVGVNAAIYDVVRTVLLRPLPLAEADRLVWIWGDVKGVTREGSVAPADFRDLKARMRSSAALTAFVNVVDSFVVRRAAGTLRADGRYVARDFFAVLGVPVFAGRDFRDGEGAPGHEAAIVSHAWWTSALGGDPRALVEPVTVNGRPMPIVGVLPPGGALQFLGDADFWVARDFDVPSPQDREWTYLRPIARLDRGVARATAQASLDTIGAALAADHPATNAARRFRAVPLQAQVTGGVRPVLLLLLGIGAAIWLIAIANAATLRLARVPRSRIEASIRVALGASPGNVRAECLVDGLTAGGGAAVASVALAAGVVRAIVVLLPAGFPRSSELGFGLLDAAWTGGLALFSGLVVAAIEAWALFPRGGTLPLRETPSAATATSAGRSFQHAVLALQMGGTLALLMVAIQLVRGVRTLEAVEPGFRSDHVLRMEVSLDPRPRPDPEVQTLYLEMLSALERLPDVAGVGLVSELPLTGQANDAPYEVPGTSVPTGTPLMAHFRWITPGYFDVLRIGFRAGRSFSASEASSETFSTHVPVVVVNEQLCLRHWPLAECLGKTLSIGGTVREIVGVVQDVRHDRLDLPPQPEAYVPCLLVPSTNLVIRTAGDPSSVAKVARAAIAKASPEFAVVRVEPFDAVVGRSLSVPTLAGSLSVAFALLATWLAVVGTYATVRRTVAERRRELAVRMALGASPASVKQFLLSQLSRVALLGLGIGLTAGFAALHAAASLLFGVRPWDAAVAVGAALCLGVVALLACRLATRDADRCELRELLRGE